MSQNKGVGGAIPWESVLRVGGPVVILMMAGKVILGIQSSEAPLIIIGLVLGGGMVFLGERVRRARERATDREHGIG